MNMENKIRPISNKYFTHSRDASLRALSYNVFVFAREIKWAQHTTGHSWTLLEIPI